MTDDGPTFERFAEVAQQYDPDAIEERVFAHWDAVDAYERTKQHRADGEDFFFVDGPPYTSGSAHMGTTWNKALKDAYIRHLRMRGYDVTDRPGFDMHGLPIETKVEEELGFQNKKDIAEYGEERFIEACKAFAEDNLQRLREDFESFGVWMDWEDPYKTVDPSYMEAAWWGFAQAHERGLVEQGQRSINQCPRCETAIANNEVEYHDAPKPSIYVRFPLADREGSLVIWTTTPWTIVANTFVAVDEELTYVGVDAERPATGGDSATRTDRLYVAEACLEEVLSAGRYDDYEIVEELSGTDLVGWQYEHPLAEQVPDHAQAEGSLQVYGADYVEADRTGLVHSAPGHGEEDFERGRELGLETFCPVGTDGVYTEAAGTYAGEFVRDANDAIVADLDAAGYLLANEDGHTVREGQCWRCDTDIVRIVTDQWFITITDVKDELLANIEDTEWYPDWARDNRFRDFVEEAPDWNVSRQRYWGIPIPIWTPEQWDGSMDDAIVVGDREELADRVDQDVDPETVDLHKGTVDELTITENGRTYTRVPDVFDVWLDSSVATWGTIEYPEETEAFDALWPADLIVEAHDQTRGWFWSQLGMGTAATGEVPYRDVVMHGHALDEDGRKMSKSVGNVVQPAEAIERHGRDAMRLFLLSFTGQGEDMRFSWDEMANRARQLNILWNVFRFPLPYMRMDGFDPATADLQAVASDLETVDRWILSRLQTVEATMADHFEDYEQDAALEALLEFVVEDLSRFYVQAVRDRVWEEGESASKTAAYATLYRVLRETVALLAPYAPFVTEAIYGHLTGGTGHPTVHMCDWPTAEDKWREETLETDVAVLRSVEQAGGAARQQAGRSRRWPVARVVVDAPTGRVAAAVERHRDLLAKRLNARQIEVVGPEEEWVELTYAAEADMSEVGPAFGADADAVVDALNEASVEEWSMDALATAVEEETGLAVEIESSMVEPIRSVPPETAQQSFAVPEDATRDGGEGRVYVDAALTPDLESEGYAREVIRRAQELRKDLELDVDERVRLEIDVADDRVTELIGRRADLVDEAVRVAERGAVEGGRRERYEIDGVEVTIAIAPVAGATA